MARIAVEHRGYALRGALELARALLAALMLSLFAFPATAAASKRVVHFHGHAFERFIASLWPLAEQRGVSRTTFDRAFAGVSFDPKVVAVSEAQPEFVRPIWQYVASAVSGDRVERGRAEAEEASAWLTKARETYGVEEAVILAVWGIETDFGRFVGSNSVIRALATLAYIHFQGDFFRDELLSALVILEEGDIAPSLMRGSWAGAMGQTQFMPSSYLAYAVDFEGHGRRDIWTSEADAIGSTANYLVKHGWTAGLPWGFEVRLPSDFRLSDADSSSPAPFSQFAARGVERADGAPWPESGEGRLLILAGLKGPVFVVTANFDVIKAYNNSTAYALSVGLLRDAVKGGRGLVAQWPANDRPPSEAQVRALQAKLKNLGYNAGEVDGKIGDALRKAVRIFQERDGLAPDGYVDLALLKRVAASRCLASPNGLNPPSNERERSVQRCGVSQTLPAAQTLDGASHFSMRRPQ
jgi:lytic murein transglycosylase